MYSAEGAVSNGPVNSFSIVGDIGTLVGEVSGFGAPYDGTYTNPISTEIIEIEVSLYDDQTKLPISTRNVKIQANGISPMEISTACLINTTVPTTISAGVTVTGGVKGVVFGNRSLHIAALSI